MTTDTGNAGAGGDAGAQGGKAGADGAGGGAGDTTKTGADGGTGGSGDAGAGGGEGTGESLLDGVDGAGEGEGVAAVDFSKGKPEGFPDDAWDAKENKPKADVLYKRMQDAENRAKGLRDKLAKGDNKPPKDAKEYQFKPTEKGSKAFKDGDISKDPVVAAMAPIAKKYGLSKEQYAGVMTEMADVLVDLAEKNAQPPELSDEEKAEIKKAEYSKIGTNAVQVVKAVESWARELKETGQFSEGDLKAFKSMAMNGDQVRVLNKLRAIAGGGNSIPMDFSDDGLPDDEAIGEMIANIKSQADQDKVDALLTKRQQAGRPEKLKLRV